MRPWCRATLTHSSAVGIVTWHANRYRLASTIVAGRRLARISGKISQGPARYRCAHRHAPLLQFDRGWSLASISEPVGIIEWCFCRYEIQKPTKMGKKSHVNGCFSSIGIIDLSSCFSWQSW